jgi:hypothetical protein
MCEPQTVAVVARHVVRDNILPWSDDKGVQYINIEDFLLEKINEL